MYVCNHAVDEQNHAPVRMLKQEKNWDMHIDHHVNWCKTESPLYFVTPWNLILESAFDVILASLHFSHVFNRD